jgi:hypothetical protein
MDRDPTARRHAFPDRISDITARLDALDRKVRDNQWTPDNRTLIVKTSGGNETRGLSNVTARYRVDSDGFMNWQGHYSLNTGVNWPTGSLMLYLPANPEDTFFVANGVTSMPGSSVRAYNGSFFFGNVEYGGGANFGLALLYQQNPSAAFAWTTTIPFTWAPGHVLSWNLRYPVA